MRKPEDLGQEEWDSIIEEGRSVTMGFFIESVIEMIQSMDEQTAEQKIATTHVTFNHVIPTMLNPIGLKVYSDCLRKVTEGLDPVEKHIFKDIDETNIH